jgi:hypothetical protein
MDKTALRRLVVTLLLATCGITVLVPAASAADNPGVLPPGRNYGATSGEWAARWWQWALGQPLPSNPLADETGANCAVGQSGPVWFLAGNFGGTTTRSCTVPAGKAIFFPVANAFSCNDPGVTATFGRNRVVSRTIMKQGTNLSASLDGVPIQHLQSYQAHATSFTITLPENNVFGIPAEACTSTAADGVYLMLAPLSAGAHTVRFHAEFPGGDPLDVTYNLVVGP